MEAVKLVSELFMMVLCIFAGPFDQKDAQKKGRKEIKIDLVGNRGYMDTLIVKRTEDGFTAYDEMNGKLAEIATIQPVKGKKHVYLCKDAKGKSETVDLAKSIVDFESLNLRKAKRKILRLKDDSKIRFNRSGNVIYLTPSEQKRTYVVH